jgi:hypothetical protein
VAATRKYNKYGSMYLSESTVYSNMRSSTEECELKAKVGDSNIKFASSPMTMSHSWQKLRGKLMWLISGDFEERMSHGG